MNDLENNVLNRLFTEMDESLRKLRSLSKLSEDEFLGHYEKIDTAKYNFIVAIEAIIDICNRIISKRKLGFPNDFQDVIDAARIKAEYPLSFADCFAVATARRESAIILTGDPEFKKIEHLAKIESLSK